MVSVQGQRKSVRDSDDEWGGVCGIGRRKRLLVGFFWVLDMLCNIIVGGVVNTNYIDLFGISGEIRGE